MKYQNSDGREDFSISLFIFLSYPGQYGLVIFVFLSHRVVQRILSEYIARVRLLSSRFSRSREI